jgi:chromosome segregation ATPase
VKWDSPIGPDIDAFFEAHPLHGQKWKGPKQYDDSLTRMGVSQAMRGVLALPQGETGKILQDPPPKLLRSILQLTGKQEIIDAYLAERKKFEAAQGKHLETLGFLKLEEAQLKTRELEANQYLEWDSMRRELTRIEEVLIPAGKYRDLVAQRDELAGQLDGLERRVRADTAALEELEGKVPGLEEAVSNATAELDRASRGRGALKRFESRLTVLHGKLDRGRRDVAGELERAELLVGGRSLQTLTARRDEVKESSIVLGDRISGLRAAIRDVEAELVQLKGGQTGCPTEVSEFRSQLNELGVNHVLVADVIEPGATSARQAEAALGDAVWAVVVGEDDFSKTLELAAGSEYRWPIGKVRTGNPIGVLAGITAPADLGAVLAELDLPAAPSLGEADGQPRVGAAADGFVHRPYVSQLRGPSRSRIGREARAKRIEEIEEVLPRHRADLESAEREGDDMAAELLGLIETIELEPKLPALGVDLERVEGRTRSAAGRLSWAEKQWIEVDERTQSLTRSEQHLRDDLSHLRADIEREKSSLSNRRPQLDSLRESARIATAAVAEMRLDDAQQAAVEAGNLAPTDELDRNARKLREQVEDDFKFPPTIRAEHVLADRDEQRDIVTTASEMVGTAAADMTAQQGEIDRAREAYDRNVSATLRLLDGRFRIVCESAGVVGEIRRVAGDMKGEWGLDILAAHKLGERPVSYQRRNYHSGGQTVKLAILLLLAAMSMGDEGSAEMLIMDEPIAHMSVENADQIAEVIVGLKDRAQFVLAMPTNAETLRVDWAEWQISLLPREPRQAHSPPVQIMSSLEVDTEERFSTAQLTIGG